jgi:type IV pilus assembly protein PilE
MAQYSSNPGASGRSHGRRRQAGFTLIEVMIAVVIVAVLAGIAYASYQNQVVNSRRAAAAACLQERAQFMERHYTTNLSYADAPAPAQCDGSIANFYRIPAPNPTARTYTLQAVPQGIQATKDAKCGTLSINHLGQREASGPAPDADCW